MISLIFRSRDPLILGSTRGRKLAPQAGQAVQSSDQACAIACSWMLRVSSSSRSTRASSIGIGPFDRDDLQPARVKRAVYALEPVQES